MKKVYTMSCYSDKVMYVLYAKTKASLKEIKEKSEYESDGAIFSDIQKVYVKEKRFKKLTQLGLMS